ncbi:MAG: UDP-4-amino-4,6-dideoxy-N-acetyl-beta-L-altrosamine transaminase, partial [Thermovirga sp.]|nr:UDP-4-amino-4,6-dideoxy-N-acetyl-beta-L-altrosamine transaminase [Thermovirga sp.]
MRETFLPFARPDISEEAIADVADSLRSGWITTGPKAQRFEKSFGEYLGVPYALAVNSATAGLHLALLAFGIGPGDEVITTPMTFAATANTVILTGARPVLADIDPVTLNIRPELVKKAVTPRTKAIIPVHFAGRPCEMETLEEIAEKNGLVIIEDAAHALGASRQGRPIGAPARERQAAVFSFHPTKNIT